MVVETIVASLIKIADRLISLVKIRVQSRKEVFSKIMKPTFEDMQAIHGDYREMIEDVLAVFSETQSAKMPKAAARRKYDAAVKTLRKRRLKLEPVRAKSNMLLQELVEVNFPPEEKAFVRSVERYFPTLAFMKTATIESDTSAVIDVLMRTLSAPDLHEAAAGAVVFMSNFERERKQNWKEICKTYAALEITISQLR